MLRGPRWMHHIIAELGGYFWLPCPVCGRMFGGHEWRPPYPSIFHEDGFTGTGVCSMECARKGQQ